MTVPPTPPRGEHIPEKRPYANPSLSGLQFSFSQKGGNRVAAHDPKRTGPDAHKPVGYMEWNKTTGEINAVGTHPSQARRGLATVLMDQARQRSADSQPAPKPMKGQGKLFSMPAEKRTKVVAPKHSRVRTDAGDKWARSVGGYLPPLAKAPSRRAEYRR